MWIFKITECILSHLITGIKKKKYIANIIRMAAKLNKFSLSSFDVTYRMVVLIIQFVCVIYFLNNWLFNDAVLPTLVL